MSLLDSYRRNLQNKREELTRLQSNKANESKKIPELSSKIQRVTDSISRTNSASTIRSKYSEIERYQREKTNVEKKISAIETAIAKKQKEIVDEDKKIAREEENEYKKRSKEMEKTKLAYNQKITQIDKTLSKHNQLHAATQASLLRLQDLPDKIIVLFLAANPIDQEQLRLDEEARSITEMIQKSKHRDSVKFESRWAIRPMDLLQAINEFSPTIVHFSGHGSNQDEIVFQDSNGNTKLVSKEALVQTMMASSETIRLVFFNTCYSRNQAESVVKYVDAAIGMNTSIGDEAARIFSSQFYSSIGFGLSVKKSFDQAKALLMMEGIPEENTPELFVHEGVNSEELVIVKPT
ncbi:CHAT domain-containing protein [Leptospira dzoumogneensis]|uniref:CHAT domain-containing protein n=1 Tax=Leptospira dzoumogneensis TaxID=2484904 RepID=A0A4Z1APK7_9LEPT|nr:CHAT domain-containing protein [Leptospira dzoumogneensis]